MVAFILGLLIGGCSVYYFSNKEFMRHVSLIDSARTGKIYFRNSKGHFEKYITK